VTEINPPYALQGGTINHPAKLFRRALAGAVKEGVTVFTTTDLKVTQHAPTGMSVDVARGGAFVTGDDTQDQGLYFCYNDGAKQLTIAASDPTNPRKDIVVFHVKDNTEGQAGDTSVLEVVTGTPAPSPAEPALPSTAIKLATVDVAALATAITNANITDRRSIAGLSAVPNPPRVKVRRASTTQNFVDATWTTISWDTEDKDTDGMWTVGTPTRFTIVTPGDYLFGAEFAVVAGTTGRLLIRFLKNGAAFPARSGFGQTANTSSKASETTLIPSLVAGDYIEVQGFQDSGATRACDLTTEMQMVGWAVWQGQ